MAAVTNNCQLRGLTNTHLLPYRSGGQKFEVSFRGPNSKYWQGCLPLGGLRKNPFPCLFQLLVATCIPWLIGSWLCPPSAQAVMSPTYCQLMDSLFCLHLPVIRMLSIIFCPEFRRQYRTKFRNQEVDIPNPIVIRRPKRKKHLLWASYWFL